MEITVLQCPKCGGDINFKTGDRTVKCPYCDSLLEIKADSAEIALEKAKKEFSDIKSIRQEYAKKTKRWKRCTYIYYGLVCLLTITAFLLIARCKNHSGGYELGGGIFILLCFSFLAVPFIFSQMVPVAPKEVEDQLRIKSGLLGAAKIAGLAMLLALASAFISTFIVEALGPSKANLEERAEIIRTESED